MQKMKIRILGAVHCAKVQGVMKDMGYRLPEGYFPLRTHSLYAYEDGVVHYEPLCGGIVISKVDSYFKEHRHPEYELQMVPTPTGVAYDFVEVCPTPTGVSYDFVEVCLKERIGELEKVLETLRHTRRLGGQNDV